MKFVLICLVVLLTFDTCRAGCASTQTTNGGCCVFPFEYGGEQYHSCTTEDDSQPWCSLTAVYVGYWGVCEESTGAEFVCDNCNIEYKRVGCFKDQGGGGRALGDYILSDRDPSVSVYSNIPIDWYEFGPYLKGFACRCARLAKLAGNKYFGLQFWGECWSAPEGYDDYAQHGPSNECYNTEYHECTDDDKHCVGKSWRNFVYEIQDCDYQFERIGCYADGHGATRPLPDYILTDRDTAHHESSNISIDWVYYDTYMPDFACRCAQEAVERGHDIFGLQYYGECWTGSNGINTYNIDGASTECIDKCYRECTNCDKYCIGKGFANFVYRIVDNTCAGLTTTKLGCYAEDTSNRVLDVQLVDDVLPYSDKYTCHYYDEESTGDWNWYIKGLTCRCAVIAHEQGYPIFGIINGGECWAGLGISVYVGSSTSSGCYRLSGNGEQQNQCVSGPYCAGSSDSIYVHLLNP